MVEPNNAQWHHIEAIREMDGIVDVEWESPLRVIIHKDIRNAVESTLLSKGYEGKVNFVEMADNEDEIIAYQATYLNNFDLLLIPSSQRADLGDFGIPLDDPIYDDVRPLWKAVDEVMHEYGISSEYIKEWRRNSPDRHTDPEYHAILVPLFTALRKKGFSAIQLRG